MEKTANQIKYENYKEQSKRMNSAMNKGFYLEALFIQRKLDKEDFSYKIFNNLSFLNNSREECWSIIDFMFSFLDVLEQLGMNIQDL